MKAKWAVNIISSTVENPVRWRLKKIVSFRYREAVGKLCED